MEFMRTMMEEKGVINKIMDFESEGEFHIVPVLAVVEFIESSPEELRAQVNQTLSKIDYQNGNVLNFVEYLARGMVQI